MAMAEAGAPAQSGARAKADNVDCPVMDTPLATQLRTCVRESNAFSLGVLEFLQKKSPAARAAWLKTTVEAGRSLFQPWATEILYVIAVNERARFTELQDQLGISSRTLSDKLRMLREEGFIEREVHDEQPVRIEYFLTKKGRTTAALASPLLAQLNDNAAPPRR